MIRCAKCGRKVGVTGPCRTCHPKPKRNSTTIVIVGGGKRRNPARSKTTGRFVKRRR